MRRHLAAVALHLAGQPAEESLARDGGINVRTAAAYDSALTALALMEIAPAVSSRIKRLTRSPKRHLVDTALAAVAADLEEREIIEDGNLRGRWFDAFAAMQLRAELATTARPRSAHHLRVEGGRHEVDLVVDRGRGRLFALEFKAGTAPTRRDARHLLWLRDELKGQFVGGLVLHSGNAVVVLADRIAAVPLSAIWAGV